jgi:PKD repeat protein
MFGDGGTSAVQNPSHPYATTGDKNITLTVTDGAGRTYVISHTFTVT